MSHNIKRFARWLLRHTENALTATTFAVIQLRAKIDPDA